MATRTVLRFRGHLTKRQTVHAVDSELHAYKDDREIANVISNLEATTDKIYSIIKLSAACPMPPDGLGSIWSDKHVSVCFVSNIVALALVTLQADGQLPKNIPEESLNRLVRFAYEGVLWKVGNENLDDDNDAPNRLNAFKIPAALLVVKRLIREAFAFDAMFERVALDGTYQRVLLEKSLEAHGFMDAMRAPPGMPIEHFRMKGRAELSAYNLQRLGIRHEHACMLYDRGTDLAWFQHAAFCERSIAAFLARDDMMQLAVACGVFHGHGHAVCDLASELVFKPPPASWLVCPIWGKHHCSEHAAMLSARRGDTYTVDPSIWSTSR